MSLIQLRRTRAQVIRAAQHAESEEEHLRLLVTLDDLNAEIRFARAQRARG